MDEKEVVKGGDNLMRKSVTELPVRFHLMVSGSEETLIVPFTAFLQMDVLDKEEVSGSSGPVEHSLYVSAYLSLFRSDVAH